MRRAPRPPQPSTAINQSGGRKPSSTRSIRAPSKTPTATASATCPASPQSSITCKKLGVNVIWLSPHYDSPNADNGYDIRDYRKVMTEFGTMDDFDALLAGIKQRHMRLIIDLVVNHTSDEHDWFVESRKSKDNPYRDYYIWRPGKTGPTARASRPTTDPSFFSGSAWQHDPATNEYYLHYFAVKQPDLNWDNPKVRNEVYDLMRFWLDKGVDGFRMDVIPLISKRPDLPRPPSRSNERTSQHIYAMGPHLRRISPGDEPQAALSKYDDMTVGEALGITLDANARCWSTSAATS